MTTTTNSTAALVAAATATVTSYAAGVRPLLELSAATAENPPRVSDALLAVLHLNGSQLAIDAATTNMFKVLIAAGVTEPKLARLLGIRSSVLSARLSAEPAPTPAPVTEVEEGWFALRDRTSVRAARETLILAAGGVGVAYRTALAPLSAVAKGSVTDTATLDAALSATLHLHAAGRSLSSSLDPVLGALTLGGVKRMALSNLLSVNHATLQRRLQHQPLASARGCDLAVHDGVWTVRPAAVGRYAPQLEKTGPDAL